MKRLDYFLFIILFCFSSISLASTSNVITIKVAILDNFNLQKSIMSRYNNFYVDKYKKSYLPGLDLAKNKARKKGYNIIYKQFTYDRSPLGIIKIIDAVKQWKPDFILGPSDSNTFLLLSNYFHDTLVISPFATSDDVAKMPRNFYSLTAPSKYMARAIATYLDDNYRKNRVFGVIERNCRNCLDLSIDFLEQQKSKRDIHYEYISLNVLNKSDLNKILSHRKNGDIFFLPDTSYFSAILISKITPMLNNDGVFIGGDGWGSWIQTHVGKVKTLGEYTAIRVTPWSLDINSERVKKFKKEYIDFFGVSPLDNTPYHAYNAIDSVIESLVTCKTKISSNIEIHDKILTCYMKSLDRNKNWFRPSDYAVYRMYQNGQELVSVIHVNLEGK